MMIYWKIIYTIDNSIFDFIDQVYLTNQRQVLPTITLSADTKACLEELDKPIVSPFESSREASEFSMGRPKAITQINKSVVMDVIGKVLSGLLRIKGFDCKFYCKFYFTLSQEMRKIHKCIAIQNIFQIAQKAVCWCSRKALRNSINVSWIKLINWWPAVAGMLMYVSFIWYFCVWMK